MPAPRFIHDPSQLWPQKPWCCLLVYASMLEASTSPPILQVCDIWTSSLMLARSIILVSRPMMEGPIIERERADRRAVLEDYRAVMSVEHCGRVNPDALAGKDAVLRLLAPGDEPVDVGAEVLLVVPHDVAGKRHERRRLLHAPESQPLEPRAYRGRFERRDVLRGLLDVRRRYARAFLDDELALHPRRSSRCRP